MRKTLALAILFAFGVVALGPSAPTAQADTISFASGMESNGSDHTCFNWNETAGSVGLTRNTSFNDCNRHYFTPLYWRASGSNKTVSITYRRASTAATVTCIVPVYDSNGTFVKQGTFSMPVTGTGVLTYSTVSATWPPDPVTGLTDSTTISTSQTAFVICTIEATVSGVSLLKVNWNP